MFCAPMGDRRLLCWPPPRYLKELLQYCAFLLFFVVIGLIFVTSLVPSNQCSPCGFTVSFDFAHADSEAQSHTMQDGGKTARS